MTNSLREKIARIIADEDMKHRSDEFIDAKATANKILAIPELADALRLKPIKTMPVREKAGEPKWPDTIPSNRCQHEWRVESYGRNGSIQRCIKCASEITWSEVEIRPQDAP